MKSYAFLSTAILLAIVRISDAVVPLGVADDTGFLPPLSAFVESAECLDDATFAYTQDAAKTCDWVGKKNDRRLQLCGYKFIANRCARTCRTCCGNDSDFMFETNNVGMKDCEWLGLKQERKDEYCNKSFGGHKINQKCPVSCDRCTTANPSSSPSKSDGETSSACSDDLTFYINKDETKTCDWMGLDAMKVQRENLCAKPYIESACARTCGTCCGNDADFTFMTDNVGKQNCEWLGKKSVRIGAYCKRTIGGHKIQQKCAVSCSLCMPEEANLLEVTDENSDIPSSSPSQLRVMPSGVPSGFPTSTVSASPSLTESSTPSTAKPMASPVGSTVTRKPLSLSGFPTSTVSASPSVTGSSTPSTAKPSGVPSGYPTISNEPSTTPSTNPSKTKLPSSFPSLSPTLLPSIEPTVLNVAQCEVVATLSFPALDNFTMNEGGFHQDELRVQIHDSADKEICCNMNNITDFCEHGGSDGAFATDDYYYDESEFATIWDAAGNTFDIMVVHYFNIDEMNSNSTTDTDHTMVGVLTIAVNGKDAGEEWSHDHSQNVDTHIDGMINDEYDRILVVEMHCSEECQCSFEKTA